MVVLGVFSLLAIAFPAEALAARRPATFVYVESDPGDPSARGLTYLSAAPDATVRVIVASSGTSLDISSPAGELDFSFYVFADQKITTGVHQFSSPSRNGYEMGCSLAHAGCSSIEGTLDVRQLQMSKNGRVTRFDMTFEAYSTGSGSGRMRGHLAYRSTKSIELPRTSAVLRGGEVLQDSRSLLNAELLDGGTSYGDVVQRVVVTSDARIEVLRRTWPDQSSNRWVDEVAWTSPTQGPDGARLTLSTSGRLSLLGPTGAPLWSIRPKGAGRGTFLLVDHAGRLLLVDSRFKVLWSAG